jgi:hypothetical protein
MQSPLPDYLARVSIGPRFAMQNFDREWRIKQKTQPQMDADDRARSSPLIRVNSCPFAVDFMVAIPGNRPSRGSGFLDPEQTIWSHCPQELVGYKSDHIRTKANQVLG